MSVDEINKLAELQEIAEIISNLSEEDTGK